MKKYKLEDLLTNIEVIDTKGDLGIFISGLSFSSNEIEKDFLFCAIRGEHTDGHKYINEAVQKGAAVILCEEFPNEINDKVTYVKVFDSRVAITNIALKFYNYPSDNFKLIGVTGTNGKTTVAYLLYSLFTKLGKKCGLISTIGDKVGNTKANTSRTTPTTPDSISLNKLFVEMAEADCEYVFMEVSSHALALGRMQGINFTGGIFTNLTHDHLDFHGSLENYRDAKKEFFDLLPENAFAISNIDDSEGEYMLSDTKAKKHFYGLKCDAEFGEKLDTKLVGDFNQYNILAVYSVSVLLGQDQEKVKDVLKNLSGVPGRFESVEGKSGVLGVVDYAHTPDAVLNALEVARKISKERNGKLITVVGCGGDRDKTKRPKMARIGDELSDVLIMTSDNPRTENPKSILDDMRAGILNADENKIYLIEDRREAIQKACEIAKKGDVVAILGKGHEDYQEVNDKKTHFSDMKELKHFLEIV